MSHVTITIVTRTGRVEIREGTGDPFATDNPAIQLGRAVGRAMGALRPEVDQAAIMLKQVHHALRDAGLLGREESDS